MWQFNEKRKDNLQKYFSKITKTAIYLKGFLGIIKIMASANNLFEKIAIL